MCLQPRLLPRFRFTPDSPLCDCSDPFTLKPQACIALTGPVNFRLRPLISTPSVSPKLLLYCLHREIQAQTQTVTKALHDEN